MMTFSIWTGGKNLLKQVSLLQGGQLASLHSQYDYDQLVALTNGGDDCGQCCGNGCGDRPQDGHFMLGLHSDGHGNWENTDGSP